MSVLRLARRAMGTTFEVVLAGGRESHLRAAAEAALDEIGRLEDQLSVYLPTSEISAINRAAAREALPVEPALFALLQRAAALTAGTDGAFDLTVGPLMEAYGFGRGARGNVAAARRCAGMRHVRLEEGTIRFARRGMRLDLGALGKGYALDRAARILRDHGVRDAFLHGGTSTVLALGAPPDADGWTVGVADPRDDERRLGTLTLRDRALSTSASLGRVVQRGGQVIGHVLDPRDGRPVRRPAAWAVTDSAADADALSTAFLVLGAAAARRWVAEHPGSGALVLDRTMTQVGLAPAWEASPRRPRGWRRRDVLKGAAAAAAAFSVGGRLGTAGAEDDDDGFKPVAPPKTLKVGLVGAGVHGRLLLGQLARMKAVAVPAVCDVDPKALEAAVKLAGRSVETYLDVAYMLEEEALDALVVATPTHDHRVAAVAGLAAGLHVYVEAPLARSLEDCRAIVRAAAKHERVVHVGHQRRTSKLYPHARTHATSGAIGKTLQVRAAWHRRQSWRRGGTTKKTERAVNWRLYRETSGGLLLEHGSHAFDLATWFFGGLPEAVTGFGSLQGWKDGRDVDDTVQVVLRYPGGGQMSYDATLVGSYGGERELIVGDQASMLFIDQHKGLLFKEADTVAAGWEQYAKTEMLGARRGIVLDPEATKYVSHEKGELVGPEADKADFHAALTAFLAAARSGREPVCSARDGLHAAVIALAAETALREGRVVELTKEWTEV